MCIAIKLYDYSIRTINNVSITSRRKEGEEKDRRGRRSRRASSWGIHVIEVFCEGTFMRGASALVRFRLSLTLNANDTHGIFDSEEERLRKSVVSRLRPSCRNV